MQAYQPPFTITPTIIGLISEISENLGRLSVLNTIKANLSPQVTPQDSPQVRVLLEILIQASMPMSRNELQTSLKLKERKSFRARYLKPALDNDLIEMTIPDKPNSRLHKYVLTKQGKWTDKS